MCGMNLGNKEEKDLKIENAKKNIRRKEIKYANEVKMKDKETSEEKGKSKKKTWEYHSRKML